MDFFDDYSLKPESDTKLLAYSVAKIDQLRAHARKRGVPPDLEEIGSLLYPLAFPRSTYDGLDDTAKFALELSTAHQKGRILRVWIPSSPPESAALPWEYLWIPPLGRRLFKAYGVELPSPFLFLNPHCAVVRDCVADDRLILPRSLGKLRVLFAWSNPAVDPWADVPAQKLAEAAHDQLKSLAKLVELRVLATATRWELRQAIESFCPDVLHYSGHGAIPGEFDCPAEPALVLDAPGRYEYLTARELASFCGTGGPRIFVLNCCFAARGGSFGRSFAAHLFDQCNSTSAVVAHLDAIQVPLAGGFARTLYESISQAQPVEIGVQRYRCSFERKPSLHGCGMPVAFLRTRDSRLFEKADQNPYPLHFSDILGDVSSFLGRVIGRDFLVRQVEDYVAECESRGEGGLFLLTAGAGTGKSAFIAKLVERHQRDAVWFLFSKRAGIRDPQVFVRSVYRALALRRGELLPEPAPEREHLEDELRRISERCIAEKSRQWLFIDALDESLPSSDVSALDTIPVKIPARIFFVVTSRPGRLANMLVGKLGAAAVLHHHFDPNCLPNQHDIREITEAKLRQMFPETAKLDTKRIQRLSTTLSGRAHGRIRRLAEFLLAFEREQVTIEEVEYQSARFSGSMTARERFLAFLDQIDEQLLGVPQLREAPLDNYETIGTPTCRIVNWLKRLDQLRKEREITETEYNTTLESVIDSAGRSVEYAAGSQAAAAELAHLEHHLFSTGTPALREFNEKNGRILQILSALQHDSRLYADVFGIRFVFIPPGRSTLGTLDRPLYLAETPISEQQWRSILAEAHTTSDSRAEAAKRDVSIGDLREFINIANERTDLGRLRFPSAAEWRYASLGVRSAPRRQEPPALRAGPPSSFGLYDLHGNVRQFCCATEESIERFVLKGTSWYGGDDCDLLATSTFLRSPEYGFRPAFDPFQGKDAL